MYAAMKCKKLFTSKGAENKAAPCGCAPGRKRERQGNVPVPLKGALRLARLYNKLREQIHPRVSFHAAVNLRML